MDAADHEQVGSGLLRRLGQVRHRAGCEGAGGGIAIGRHHAQTPAGGKVRGEAGHEGLQPRLMLGGLVARLAGGIAVGEIDDRHAACLAASGGAARECAEAGEGGQEREGAERHGRVSSLMA